MDDLYEKLSNFKLWGNVEASNNGTCDVTELRHYPAHGHVTAQDGSIRPAALDNWLKQGEEGPVGLGKDEYIIVGRFVWIEVKGKDGGKKEAQLATSTQAKLHQKFGLELAHNYSRSSVAGITALPPVPTQTSIREAYSVSYAPKLAAIWSYTRNRPPLREHPISAGIVYLESDKRDTLKMYLKASPWQTNVATHPLFLAFILSVLFHTEINDVQESLKQSLRLVERRTGFHNFKSRLGAFAEGELADLAAKVSGYKTKLASTTRKSKTLEKMLDFIVSRATGHCSHVRRPGDEHRPGTMMGRHEPCAMLKDYATVMKDRLDFQLLDAEYTSTRIQSQIDALFTIITQGDSMSNYKLAQSTAAIAYYSYRDASSMKTLAIVTMLFLPGSFISALFSTPCFDWDSVDMTETDSIGVNTTPQFKLYWAITLPLTALTFVSYFFWLLFQKRERDRVLTTAGKALEGDKAMPESTGDIRLGSVVPEPEINRLARERTLLHRESTFRV